MYGTLALMADVRRLSPVPRIGDMFLDARGDERSMRVSLHPERGLAVVSLWAGTTCRATFQLPLDDASRLSDLLAPPPAADEGLQYPGLQYPGLEDAVHTTGLMAIPDLPQAC